MLSRRLRLSGDFDFRIVAKRTPGFVGADLAALMKESAALAVKRIFQELEATAAAEEAARAAEGAAAAAAGVPEGMAAEQQLPITPGPTLEQPEDGTARPLGLQQDVQQPAAAGEQQAAGAGGATAPQRRLGAGALSSVELAGLAITMADFEEAVPKVQPSVRREGFATTPDVTWDDVGSLGEVRGCLPACLPRGCCGQMYACVRGQVRQELWWLPWQPVT